jgi:hypothetical protein
MCPDDDAVCICGLQGRISYIEDYGIIEISWDSVTLRQLPDEYIRQSEIEGLGWAQMCLSVDEIELASPRDSEAQAIAVAEEIENKVEWFDLGKEGEHISKVLADAEDGDDEFEAWNKHPLQVLVFPFKAKVNEVQDRGPLNDGDLVQVQGIVETDNLYGILVDVHYGRKHFVFPLCDLTVRDRKSADYAPVHDYCVWFANR